MGTGDTVLETDRLQHFFADWRAARELNRPGLLVERLDRFFAAIRMLTAPEGLPARGAVLEATRLQAALDVLRAPLAEAQAAGAFFNAWTAAGLKRDEVRNAAVLASLLDPRLCPETGPAFLGHLLQIAGCVPASVVPPHDLRKGYTVRTEDCPLGGGENRVDISIEGRGFLLFIEVKIDAGEGNRQLDRYDMVLREKARLLGARPALIFLSPRAPATLPNGAVHVTWGDLATAARRAARPARGAHLTVTEALLGQFATHAARYKGNANGPTRTRPAPNQQLGRS